ncbi:hypothetical protein BKA69DRAFT_1014819, partial [Paraphysoderma sedebokerense]
LLLVSLLWGGTNPFIRRGAKLFADKQKYASTKFDLAELQYILPLLLNLSGSVVYYWTLGDNDLSLTVPVANALTLVVTFLVGKALGEEVGSWESYFGMVFVMCGVSLCLLSRTGIQ